MLKECLHGRCPRPVLEVGAHADVRAGDSLDDETSEPWSSFVAGRSSRREASDRTQHACAGICAAFMIDDGVTSASFLRPNALTLNASRIRHLPQRKKLAVALVVRQGNNASKTHPRLPDRRSQGSTSGRPSRIAAQPVVPALTVACLTAVLQKAPMRSTQVKSRAPSLRVIAERAVVAAGAGRHAALTTAAGPDHYSILKEDSNALRE